MRHLSLILLLCCIVFAGISSDAEGIIPNKRALLIGVSKYTRGQKGDWWNLNTERDVELLQQVLISKFQFKQEKIKVLKTKEETTHQAIVETFRSFLIEPTKPGDIIYFHYSGHGAQTLDENGDEIDGLDETLVPSDYVSRKVHSNDILDDEIGTLLEELTQKRPANATLSFDCCFSGTNTRGGEMLIRGEAWSGPKPTVSKTRGGGEGPGGLLTRGDANEHGYVVISATRHDQVAKETEDDNGRPMGLLTYAFVEALYESTSQTTYRDLFDRLELLVLRRDRVQKPQLEGDEDKVLLQGIALSPQPYIEVKVDNRDNILLQAGELQWMTKGSLFKLYPAATKDFQNIQPLAEARIEELDLTFATLELEPEFQEKIKPDELQAARAVEKLHQYGDNILKVDTQGIKHLPQGEEILDYIQLLPLVNSEIKTGDRWDVRIRPKNDVPGLDALVLERRDGTVILEVASDKRFNRQLRHALEGEARWRFVNALENHALNSQVQIELRIVPVEVERNARGRVRKVIGDKKLRRTEGGQIVLPEGEVVMIELKNTGDVDAYVTVLDLQSDGTIGPLWPHPDIKNKENKILADGNWIRIRRPFFFELGQPYGTEMFKAIATSEPADFSPVLHRGTLERGGDNLPVARSPLGQLLKAATLAQRASLAGVDPSDWATSSVTFEVRKRRETN